MSKRSRTITLAIIFVVYGIVISILTDKYSWPEWILAVGVENRVL